ncbi:MAG: thiamine pyrophosphate-binding protein [Candidatus Bathyarchaeota archaeon]|nr:thiamine pyrophosphate-binding protein [Candidatus Bathyarchaeota archaeon]
MQRTLTVGEYLLSAVKNMGAKEVFGIPGDMILGFFKLIENDPDVTLYTFSHEPAVGFAAIGAARAIHKPAVAVVTYGPGALGLLNSVACAYAEKTPLVVIAGGPPLSVRANSNFSLHHTVKDVDTQLKVYTQVTAEAAVLDHPETAATKISKALTTCQEQMLPVYIEVPADIVNQPLNVPAQISPYPLGLDEKAVQQAADEVLLRISQAEKPVVMLGVEAVRFGLVDPIAALAQRLNLPFVSTMLSRDVLPLDAANFFGVFLGNAGNSAAEKLVVDSDFVLMLGEDLTDVNLGAKLASVKAVEIVRCVSGAVKVGAQVYRGVPLKALVAKLSCSKVTAAKEFGFPEKADLPLPCRSRPIGSSGSSMGTDGIVDAVNLFFREHGEMPVISDTGDCLFATLRLEASSVIGSSFYGTMGFAVPAAIGYAVTAKKRPLVLVGDGGFQMTGQEICHCPRYGVNPIFIVVNNRLWGMEQLFHPSAINELVNWRYAELAKLWGGNGYLCRTRKELDAALRDAKNHAAFSLIEVITNRNTLSIPLRNYVAAQKAK